MKKWFGFVKSLFFEYGLKWFFYRTLYTLKLKFLQNFPSQWKIFEIECDVKTLDIFSPDISQIQKFLLALPQEEKSKIIKEADNAADGKILAFRSTLLDYGKPLNWFINPITQECAESNDFWFKIPDFNVKLGDTKLVWESSRFLHFYAFVRAYILTKDEKYAEAFWNQTLHWCENNPYPLGVNWKCGQEATLRMIAFLFSYSVFKDSRLTTPERIEFGKELVKNCYKKVRSNFFYAYRCIKNNHTISESAGWIIGAYACQDMRMVRKGFGLLDETIKEQFKEDGGYIQHSFNYQRLALQVIECILSLEIKMNCEISTIAKKRILASVNLLYQCQDESGMLPNYGSNDGALIFPVTNCEYLDYRPTLQSISVRLTGSKLYLNGLYDEETLWIENKIDEQKPQPIVPIERCSSAFNYSGYYSIRRNNGFCMIRCATYDTRPAHMDALHLDIWHNGRNLFCDAGSYSYALEENHYFPATAMHNTVTCGKREQMKKISHFFVYDWIKKCKVTHLKNEFTGEIKSGSGYVHTRNVFAMVDGYLITDKVLAPQNENIKIHWHSPYAAYKEKDDIVLKDLDGQALSIISVVNADSEIEISIPEDDYSYYSQYYNVKSKATHIVYKLTPTPGKTEIKIQLKIKLI